jgi:hypothetical protein
MKNLRSLSFEERLFESIGEVISSYLKSTTKEISSYGIKYILAIIILQTVLIAIFMMHFIMTCILCFKERRRCLKEKITAKLIKSNQAQTHYYSIDSEGFDFDRIKNEKKINELLAKDEPKTSNESNQSKVSVKQIVAAREDLQKAQLKSHNFRR